MEKYAVVRYGGRQLMVTPGTKFDIERQQDAKMEVLAYFSNDNLEVGNPVLSDVEVIASIIEQKRAPKIEVRRFRNKSRYRKKKGHKQPISVVMVTDIIKKGEKKAETKVETKKAEKPEVNDAVKTPTKSATKKATSVATKEKTTKTVKKTVAKKDN